MGKTKSVRAKVAKKLPRSDPAYSTVRKSCSPGTIAIMLAGRFRGKRVTILKQLENNGPLVVSGPFKYNGVPLRRVNPAYLIATKTKVDISGVDTSKITNAVFKRAEKEKRQKGEKDFLSAAKKRAAERKAVRTAKAKGTRGTNAGKVSSDRVALQKSVDAALIAAIKKGPNGKLLPGYLRSIFTIKPGDCPHRAVF